MLMMSEGRRSVRTAALVATVTYLPLAMFLAAAFFGIGPNPWSIELILGITISVALLCLGLSLISLGWALVSRRRRQAWFVVFGTLPCGALAVPVFIGAHSVHTAALQAAALRTLPVVTAVEAFARDHGRPPQSLAELVPTYLERIPKRIPPIRVVQGPEAQQEFAGNPWALVMEINDPPVHEHVLVYVPSGNVSGVRYGGIRNQSRRLGRWAYQYN
jgi:hypothetical protein